MTIVTGDRYLDLLSTFVEENTGPLLDGGVLLKLNPVGLHYLQTRLEALEELEALRVGAPVDYLRAYVADLGDHRALEQLRRVLRLLSFVKVVAMVPGPSRDPTHITLQPFSRLRSLELRGCDLSTSAARGLLELRPILEKLICYNSADALRHVFAERTKEIQGAPVWSRLSDVSCFGNGMLFMDESLQLLPAVEVLDLSRNRFAKVANLQKCTNLKFLDAGFNNITTVASLNKILFGVTKLVLRNNALVSTRGLHRIASLEALDLSYNLISNFREVEMLGELPSLRCLWLEGNPVTFSRWYRKEALSYFSDPMKLVLDGKQTSMGENCAARKIVARRLKQRSKYGAFSPALTTRESSDLSSQLGDSGVLEDTINRAVINGPRQSSGSTAIRAKKKSSRLASILDVSGLKATPRAMESPREGSLISLASLDLASPRQSMAKSKEEIEETVHDLMQRTEVLKRTGSGWLKDLNALLESESDDKNKSQILAHLSRTDSDPGQRSSSWQKRRKRRSIPKETLSKSASMSMNSEVSNQFEEQEGSEPNLARFIREAGVRQMSKDALARYGSGYVVDENYLQAANPNTSTSIDDLELSSLDGKERHHNLPGIPNNFTAGSELKLQDQSGRFRLTEELLSGKMSVGSSSSPPQFNRDLLHRRQTLERELLLLPPEQDIYPFYDSESSSGTIYSHLSDSSDSPHHSPSAVWHPFSFDRGQNSNLPSAKAERSDSEGTSQVWSDMEALEREASDSTEIDTSAILHTQKETDLDAKVNTPVVQTSHGKECMSEDTSKGKELCGEETSHVVQQEINPDAINREHEVSPEEGKESVEKDSARAIHTESQKGAHEAASEGEGPLLVANTGPLKYNTEGDKGRIHLFSSRLLQPKGRTSRRIVRLESLSGVCEYSGWMKPSLRDESINEQHRSKSLGVSNVTGQVLQRSLSSSVQFSNPFNITRSSSADADLEKQREWPRTRSQEDSLPSTSLQKGESHEAVESSLQFHRVHHVVGPFVGQCA